MKTLLTSILLACLLVGNISLSAQMQYAGLYEDQLEPNSLLLASGYNFTEEKIDDTTFIRKTFHPESGQITRFITYASVLFQEKNGLYRAWYDDGTLAFEGNYYQDDKIGPWTEKVYEQGNYQNGKKTGLWTRFSEKGKVIFIQNYRQGQPDGKLIAYDEKGCIQFEEWYAEGDKVRTTASSDDAAHGAFQDRVDVMPRFPGCEKIKGTDAQKFQCATGQLARYLQKNQRYPKKDRSRMVEGEVLVQFTVDAQGGIGDIRVLNGLTGNISPSIQKMLRKMPKWRPGYRDGKAVPVEFQLPLVYRLDGGQVFTDRYPDSSPGLMKYIKYVAPGSH